MLPRQGEMGENTPFISKVDKSSMIEFNRGSTNLESRDLSDRPKGSRHHKSAAIQELFSFLRIGTKH